MDLDERKLDKIKGKKVPLAELFEAMCIKENIILIPGYQRNYTWSKDMALKLIIDILELEKGEKKSIALISLFEDKDNNNDIHIIDGQQRFVTLYLFYLALKSIKNDTNMDNEKTCSENLLETTVSKLKFQRDDKPDYKTEDTELKRESFLSKLASYDESKESEYSNNLNPDKELMFNNFKAIKEHLQEHLQESIEKIFDKILTKLEILVNIVYNNPEDEFLNLNFHKTPFSVCDRVRGKLLSSEVGISGNLISTRDISLLFESISKSLYINNDAYKLMIGESINNVHLDPEKSNENRINIIFENYRDKDKDKEEVDYILSNNVNFSEICFKDELVNIEYLKLLFMQQRLQDVLTVFDKKDETLKSMIRENGKRNKFFYTLLDRFNEITMCIHNNSDLTKSDLNKIEEILKDKDVLFDIMSGSLRKDIVSYSVKYDNLHQINRLFQNIEKPWDKDGISDKEVWEKTEYSLGKNEDLARYVQSSGKYILSMYADRRQELDTSRNFVKLNEYTKQENKADTTFNKEHILKITTESESKSEQTVGEYLFSETSDYKMIVPVIQREYCMGSKFPKEYAETDDNIITYIYNEYVKYKDAKDKDAEIKLSAIVLHRLDNDNRIEIFDGQQRTVTVFEIIRYLIYKINNNDESVKFTKKSTENDTEVYLKNIEFIDRLDFTTFLDGEYSLECENSKNYSESSIKNIRNYLNLFFSEKGVDECKSFLEYICNNVTFDVVGIEGEIPALVQIFMDINGGEPLTPYEIFKCKINYHFKGLVENNNKLYENWIYLVDNDWLNWFYNFMKNNETYDKNAVELNVIRIIEFCCRMISYEKNKETKLLELIKLNGFSKEKFKDSEYFIKDLTVDDFIKITTIMNNLIKIDVTNNNEQPASKILRFVAKKVEYNKNIMIEDADYCVPEYIADFKNEDINNIRNRYIYLFVKSLQDDTKNDYRKTDVVFWTILNNLKEKETKETKETNLNNLEEKEKETNIKNAMIKYNTYDVWKGNEDLHIAYLRPNQFYKYDKLLLPIPDYYYTEMEKEKTIIIFSKLSEEAIYPKIDEKESSYEELKEEDFYKLISEILTESDNTECDEYTWNVGNLDGLELKQYKIYYRYNNNNNNNKDCYFTLLNQSFGIKDKGCNNLNIFNNNLTIFNNKYAYDIKQRSDSNYFGNLYKKEGSFYKKTDVYEYFSTTKDDVTHYIDNYDPKYTPMAVLLSIYNDNSDNIDIDNYINNILINKKTIENDFKYYHEHLTNDNDMKQNMKRNMKIICQNAIKILLENSNNKEDCHTLLNLIFRTHYRYNSERLYTTHTTQVVMLNTPQKIKLSNKFNDLKLKHKYDKLYKDLCDSYNEFKELLNTSGNCGVVKNSNTKLNNSIKKLFSKELPNGFEIKVNGNARNREDYLEEIKAKIL